MRHDGVHIFLAPGVPGDFRCRWAAQAPVGTVPTNGTGPTQLPISTWRNLRQPRLDGSAIRQCRQRWISLLLRGETDSMQTLTVSILQAKLGAHVEVFDKGTRATSGDCSWILRIHHHLVVICSNYSIKFVKSLICFAGIVRFKLHKMANNKRLDVV